MYGRGGRGGLKGERKTGSERWKREEGIGSCCSASKWSPPHIQKLEDTNPQVREAGCEALGTLLKVLGERPLNIYFENVEKSKMAKVGLFHSQIVVAIKI